jgi:regulatory protein
MMEKSQVKVYINDKFEFMLDQKEIDQFGLAEGDTITQTVYEQILEGTIYHKAIQKALSVLTYRDRSEQELRTKLSQASFPDLIIEKVLAYVKNYGYFNEERFTAAYIRARMNRKSKLIIKNELQQKGVPEELIENAFLEVYGDDLDEDVELELIQKEIAKRTKDPENLTYDQKQKLIAALFRKGFDISKIRQFL